MAQISLELIKFAIRSAGTQIIWKPGKAEPHLAKRIRLGHLPLNSSLIDYESRIIHVLNQLSATVYVYEFGEIIYLTVVAPIDQNIWLVMITMEGVLETAFPPTDPEEYLSNPSFSYIGQLGDL
jgi:hypothetical protein